MTRLLENFVQDDRIEKSFWRPSLQLKVYSFVSLTYRQSSRKKTLLYLVGFNFGPLIYFPKAPTKGSFASTRVIYYFSREKKRKRFL